MFSRQQVWEAEVHSLGSTSPAEAGSHQVPAAFRQWIHIAKPYVKHPFAFSALSGLKLGKFYYSWNLVMCSDTDFWNTRFSFLFHLSIQIVFKNKASRPYSMYFHGVTLSKNAEGANYPQDPTGKKFVDHVLSIIVESSAAFKEMLSVRIHYLDSVFCLCWPFVLPYGETKYYLQSINK